MTIWKILGALMVASPFIAIFIFTWRNEGLLVALGIFAAVAVLVGVLMVGTRLLGGDWP